MNKQLRPFFAVLAVMLMCSDMLSQQDVPRFEIGGQFSLLSRNNPSGQFDDLVPHENVVKPGFGARFTYNVTKNLAVEAEGNFFPGEFESNGFDETGFPGGHMFQGQFGIKAGKRQDKIGVFGKIRPGFVMFTKVNHLVSVTPITIIHPFIGPLQFDNPQFRVGRATYASLDLGGVLELYPSRRIVTRFDLGDTIIRYGVYREPMPLVCATICIPPGIFERPAETRHNLQFTAGVGFRF